jgi:hypothetical protein
VNEYIHIFISAHWVAIFIPVSEIAHNPGLRPAKLEPHDDTESKINSSTGHQKNTHKTQDAAAKSALNEANPRSINDNLEYGGLI